MLYGTERKDYKMNNKINRPAKAIALGLVALMMCSCGSKSAKTKMDIDLSEYPINTEEKLTVWMELYSSVAAVCSNFGETQFAQEWQKRTGVDMEFIHPALGQANEAFGLMVASDEMADIIRHDWSLALGGPGATLSDNIIVPLNEYMDEYTPGLKAYLDANPEVDKSIRTDEGEYYAFPFIRNDKSLLVSQGFIIRTDWLKDCGLEMPETTAEVENALVQFRDKKGAKSPLSITKGSIGSLFRLFATSNNFYVDNGKIKYGPVEPEFKTALEGRNRWFNEGLLVKNFISADSALVNSNVLNGHTGLSYGSGGSNLGQWLSSAESTGTPLDMTGMPCTTDVKGTLPKFVAANNTYAPHGAVAISSSCKIPELAAKVLDYGFTDEGAFFFNFGTEGVSYNMVDGNPKYTDEIMKNPDGLAVNQAMSKYIMGHSAGPFIQDKRYIEQYYEREQQKEALKNWSIGVDESTTRVPTLLYTPEETSERSSILTEIEKYRDEMTNSFITGAVSFDTYDAYMQKMKDLKVDRLIEITQAAYDRYMAR